MKTDTPLIEQCCDCGFPVNQCKCVADCLRTPKLDLRKVKAKEIKFNIPKTPFEIVYL